MKPQTLRLAAAAPLAAFALLARKGEAKTGGAEAVIVATRTSYKPCWYLDEEGDLAGCEYEVLKAVDELLPQYEFKFKTSTFGNMPVELASRGSVKTLEDLQGKLVMIPSGDNSKFYGDKFSEAHKEGPSQGLLLSDPTGEAITTGLRKGERVSTFRTERDAASFNGEFGCAFLKTPCRPLQSSSHWLFTKGNAKLKGSGRLSQISSAACGDDFTAKE